MSLVSKMQWRMWDTRIVEIEAQGQLMKFRHNASYSPNQKPKKASRGIVTQFSQKSRKRLIDQMARLDRKKIAWGRQKPKFVTLTYVENMRDHKRANRDIKVYAERLQERFEKVSFVWKKEIQDRGAIHFHMMIFGMPYVPYENIAKWWGEVTCSWDAEGRAPFTRIEAINSINGVMYYVSKYMTKIEGENESESESEVSTDKRTPYSQAHQTVPKPPLVANKLCLGLTMLHNFSQQNSTGRWWGVYGRKHLPVGDKVKFSVVVPQATVDIWIEQKVKSGWAHSEKNWTVYKNNALGIADEMYKIMASAVDLHEQYEYKWMENKHAQRLLDMASDYIPSPLFGMIRAVQNRNHNHMLDIQPEENKTRLSRLERCEVTEEQKTPLIAKIMSKIKRENPELFK